MSSSVLSDVYIHTVTSDKMAINTTIVGLTADVVPGAGVRVTVGAAKVQLPLVTLVDYQVGVAVRRLTLGELNRRHVRRAIANLTLNKTHRLACPLGDGSSSDESCHGRGDGEESSREEHDGRSRPRVVSCLGASGCWDAGIRSPPRTVYTSLVSH